ncbi:RhoGAP domain-containing protein [Cavenderia fasciculata]|uniref:RhoGAP domain-containing protein n=1 Tax=Cavenderia fasciculata TaxID=261658 RepID=F4PUS6_CACFS|nr:RhoGAP domain-containing protein [Cavenderia fasciculata]EGG21095.1 RhoGAP domain-containing protein [Cavenderia fasciculata]|eukprot:XP_004358945.1 RhoGAP domain-containing protein [Cavenderia fasciculata]
MTEVENIHQTSSSLMDSSDEEIDLLNNDNHHNNNQEHLTIRSDSSLSKSTSSLDQFETGINHNNNNNNNNGNKLSPIPFFQPIPQQTNNTLQTSISFNNEEIMNLVQLLSCFPQPPSYVPPTHTIAQSLKSRRDTVFGSSSSTLNSSSNTLSSVPSSVTSTPTTSMASFGGGSTNNSHSNLNTSFGDLKFIDQSIHNSSNSINNNNINNTTTNNNNSPAAVPPLSNLSDSANTTPTKNNSSSVITTPPPPSSNQITAAATTGNQPSKYNIQIENETISSSSPRLLKSNQEVSISYASEKANYRLTPRGINFKPVDFQPLNNNNNNNCSIIPEQSNNSPRRDNSAPTTPTQAPTTSSPFIGVVNPSTVTTTATSSSSSSSHSTPTLNTIEVKQPPLSPEWEVNLNHLELPPPLSINGDTAGESNGDPLFEQLARSYKCEFPTSSQEHVIMLNNLLTQENGLLSMYLDKCHECVTTPTNPLAQTSSPSARRSIFVSAVKLMQNDNERPSIRLSKTLISYGANASKIGVGSVECHPAPLNIELVSTITVSSTSSKKVKFKVLMGPPSKTHTVSVDPIEGVLKKKESCSMTIRLTLKTSVRMRRAIIVEVEGGLRHYIILHAETRPTPFGLPLNKCDMVQDGAFATVPSVLVQLKRHILANGGLNVESIFRLPPGDERTLMMTRERDWTNNQPLTSSNTNDLHNSAALIKLWFRELKNPILSPIRPESFLQFEANETEPNESKINSTLNQLPEPNQTIFLWLIDLLATISKNESINKMSSKNFDDL